MEIKDECGNAIITSHLEGQINIELKLMSERRSRKVGYVDTQKKIFVISRERDKHMHCKSNSYGFNHRIISAAKTFDTVRLIDSFGIYDIPKNIILSHGKFLFFKQQGFEKQIFLPLQIIEKFKI